MRKMGQSALDCAQGDDIVFPPCCTSAAPLAWKANALCSLLPICQYSPKLLAFVQDQGKLTSMGCEHEMSVVTQIVKPCKIAQIIRKKAAKFCALLPSVFTSPRPTSHGTHPTSGGFANMMSAPTFTHLLKKS